MARVKLNHNEKLWQGVARWYKPAASAWAKYANDKYIGTYMMMVYAVNFQPGVNGLSLDNPWAIDTFEGGYELFVPEETSRESFPKGVTLEEFYANAGIDPSNPDVVVSGRLPDYIRDNGALSWTAKYLSRLKDKRALYNPRIAPDLAAEVVAGRFVR